jgi:hypothetical protein
MKRHLTAAAESAATGIASVWLLGTAWWSVTLAIASVPLTWAMSLWFHRHSIEGGDTGA